LDEVEYARADHRDAAAASSMGSAKDHRATSPTEASSQMAGPELGAWHPSASWLGEAAPPPYALAEGGKQEPGRQPSE